MTDSKVNIQEDAKSDWMKLVTKHKKKQRGLPALSKLNPSAGNVEHNIKMFNMSSSGSSSGVDTVNGNNLSCVESLTESSKPLDSETVTLHYEKIPVEVVTKRGNPGGYYNRRLGGWLPDDDITTEIDIEWDFDVPKEDVIDWMFSEERIQTQLDADNLSDEDYYNAIVNNFDMLFDEYKDEIYEYFEEDAVTNAANEYVYDSDPFYENLSKRTTESLDDVFDMSLRTLL